MKHDKLIIALLFSWIMLLFSGCYGIPVTEKLHQQNLFKGKTIYVYPVHILKATSSFDTTLSNKVVRFINTYPDMKAEMKTTIPAVNSEWGMNEAKMFNHSFNAFSKSSKKDEAMEYGLLVEVLLSPSSVIGIHYYILYNKDGKAVIGRIINSHDQNFQTINPKTQEDGIEVFKKVFSQDMIALKKGK